MTNEELTYWGQPPYPVTITDDHGHPLGWCEKDGTFLAAMPSNVGRVIKLDAGNQGLVTWDGAKPDPSKGYTKGRLLPIDGPRYVDSLVAAGYRHTDGYDGVSEDKNESTDEGKKRARRHAERKAARNRKKGQ